MPPHSSSARRRRTATGAFPATPCSSDSASPRPSVDPNPYRTAIREICAYRPSRWEARRAVRKGRGTEASPVRARASAPGLASSSIHAVVDMAKNVENSQRFRANPAFPSEWAMTSERAAPANQPMTPEAIVAPNERRTPRRRPAIMATSTISGSAVNSSQPRIRSPRSWAAITAPAPRTPTSVPYPAGACSRCSTRNDHSSLPVATGGAPG